MPLLTFPPIESRIAHKPDFDLYVKDFREDMPLYRGIKLMTGKPWIDRRRSAHLTWIVHLGRCKGGGDCWLMEQHNKELRQWIEAACAIELNAESVMDNLGIDQAEYDALVAAEAAKYKK